MYNKLFTKILDSSIWLEPHPTRIVWITLIAAMDEDGYAHFSSVKNLANRAMVTAEEAEAAVKTLESPDPESGSELHEGRRIERVPGGWMVLNAQAHRDIVSRTEKLRLNRERVARHREKRRGNALRNAPVMQSEAEAEAYSETLPQKISSSSEESEGGAHAPDSAVHRCPPESAGIPRSPPPSPEVPRKRKSGTRIPEDWKPSETEIAYAEKELPNVDVAKLAEAFVDYWRAAAGERARKVDWEATWRTWVRRSVDRYPTKLVPPSAPQRVIRIDPNGREING